MKNILVFIFVLTNLTSFSQVKNGIWFFPSKAAKINGLSLGLLEEVSQGLNKQKNGITIVLIGTGIILGGPLLHIASEERDWFYNDEYNGVSISLTGSFFPIVNGFTGSLFIGASEEVKGVSINLVAGQVNELIGLSISAINISETVKGVQIGLYNETDDLYGFQFGLWNKNKRRSLPLINWNFKKK